MKNELSFLLKQQTSSIGRGYVSIKTKDELYITSFPLYENERRAFLSIETKEELYKTSFPLYLNERRAFPSIKTKDELYKTSFLTRNTSSKPYFTVTDFALSCRVGQGNCQSNI